MAGKPLAGKLILITRPETASGAFSELLRKSGAETFEIPAVAIEPLEDYGALREALAEIESYHWIVFTSANAVSFFFHEIQKLNFLMRRLEGLKIAAIGPATSRELEVHGLTTDLLTSDSRAEGLVRSFSEYCGLEAFSKMRVLLPRAETARETFPEAMRRRGSEVSDVPVYRTTAPKIDFGDLEQRLAGRRPDVATFTSSSAARNFFRSTASAGRPDFLRGVRIAAIGPVTAATLKQLGVETHIMPERYTIPDLTQAIIEYFMGPES